jgi:hypothetical protein
MFISHGIFQLMKLAEESRTHLFDIITQYRAIFSDESTMDQLSDEAGILFSWIHQVVCEFLEILEK